jgi:small subunit ribosomal protein S1
MSSNPNDPKDLPSSVAPASQEGGASAPQPPAESAPPAVPAGMPAAAPTGGSLEVSDQELAAALGDLSTSELEQMTTQAPGGEAPTEPGQIQTGRVIRVTAEEVFIDLGGKTQGAVPLIEFAGQPLPKEGDEVSVIIERFDPATGMLALSKRGADELTFWQSVQPGDVLEGVVTGMNKGGLDIDIGGARAFLPASQVDIHRVKDISVLIGEHVRCSVTSVDRTTRDIVVSRRKVLEQERKENRQRLLDELAEGENRTGTVSSITEYGAFIDLGGIDGLLHITDMSWGRVKSARDVVQEGQTITVKVLKIDREKGKISLGLKQAEPNPWDNIEQKYPVGSRVRARVVRMAEFGAFLELEPGVDALLPISEMSWSKRIARPDEIVKVGDVPEVSILKVDAPKKRISVSMKATSEDPWARVQELFPVNSTVKGKVTKAMEYGAFVELAPGVEGLIHISELSDRRVRAVTDVVKEGQEVEVRVIKFDPEAKRISLSMKPPAKDAPEPAAEERSKKKPARKRPLRGGLASHFEW